MTSLGISHLCEVSSHSINAAIADKADELQRRRPYAVVYLMLLGPAVALGRSRGWLVGVTLFILFAAIFEVIYRKTQALIAKDRGKWWARSQLGSAIFLVYLPTALILTAVLSESAFARYFLLALLAAGVVCAVTIYFVRRQDELSVIHPSTVPSQAIRRDPMTGSCEHCGAKFQIELVHNGFNESSYAYCNQCGMTAILDCWSQKGPKGFPCIHSEILEPMEEFLQPCECGGRFTKGNAPRCPVCRQPLSAVMAATYIEAQAPGAKKG